MTSLALPAGRQVGREVRTGVHWGVAHGLPTLFLRRAADRGDLQARLIRVGSLGTDEVFDLVEEIRSRGPLYRSRIGYVATSHAAVTTGPDQRRLPDRPAEHAGSTRSHLPVGRTGDPPPGGAAVAAGDRAARPHALPQARHPCLHHAGRGEAARADRGDRRPSCSTRSSVDRPARSTSSSPTAPQLPVTVIAEILGVPEAERGEGARLRLRRRAQPRPRPGLPPLPLGVPGAGAGSTPGSARTSTTSAATPATTC